jgi:hypothetical protein
MRAVAELSLTVDRFRALPTFSLGSGAGAGAGAKSRSDHIRSATTSVNEAGYTTSVNDAGCEGRLTQAARLVSYTRAPGRRR